MSFHFLFRLCFLLVSLSSAATGFSQNPPPEPIAIGMSTALSGPTKELGTEVKEGVETYFAKINSQGGIGGRPLKLIAYDDGYEPERTAVNMRKLIDEDKVLAVIGNVGTPPAVVSVPIANEKKTLLFGALSGGDILRKVPPDRYVINVRASYAEETSAIVKALLSIGIKPDEIGFFTQNDAYGDSGYAGAMEALRDAGVAHPEILPRGRYTRNTLNVEEGLSMLYNSKEPLKAVIIVGAYAPVAKFIKEAKKEFPSIQLFVNVSFVGATSLAEALGTEGQGVIITQVFPPYDLDLPAIVSYREDIKKYGRGDTPSFGSLEGYLDAKILTMAMEKAYAAQALNREGVIDALEQMKNVDIGIGINISFDKRNHQALHQVWPTIWKEGKFVSFKWEELQ